MPCLCPGIGCVDADVNDLGNFQTPITYDLESFAVPSGIGDDIDRHRYVERASELQSFKILGERYPLSITFEAVFIDCFKTEEHRGQAKSLPKLEDLLIAQ